MGEKSNLVIGVIITLVALHYWIAVGGSAAVTDVPLIYRVTFKLFPYLDIIITALGIGLVYKGIRGVMRGN